MWCMWLSDSGSGFGKIVKRQTDLQKKCQKGLHNDMEKNENHVSGKRFWEGSFLGKRCDGHFGKNLGKILFGKLEICFWGNFWENRKDCRG